MKRKLMSPEDFDDGTVLYNPAEDIFMRLTVLFEERSWTVYFPERHENLADKDLGDLTDFERLGAANQHGQK